MKQYFQCPVRGWGWWDSRYKHYIGVDPARPGKPGSAITAYISPEGVTYVTAIDEILAKPDLAAEVVFGRPEPSAEVEALKARVAELEASESAKYPNIAKSLGQWNSMAVSLGASPISNGEEKRVWLRDQFAYLKAKVAELEALNPAVSKDRAEAEVAVLKAEVTKLETERDYWVQQARVDRTCLNALRRRVKDLAGL